jgi:Protein of unknown function (DUF2510)
MAPGWYPNPQGPGERYWDGTKWTDQYQGEAPTEQEPAPAAPEQQPVPAAPEQRTPPGWYANPQAAGQRYWDGTNWTDQYQAPSEQPAQQQGRGFFTRALLS